MPFVNALRDLLCQALVGAAYTAFNSANAYLGVGDSATAFAVTQTDLQAAANKLRKPMNATFPTVATNVMTFKSTFGAADANWTWNEVAVFNAAAGGTMMARLVAALGPKTSPASWDLTFTETVTV